MIIEYFYSHKSSPLYLITRSATVAADEIIIIIIIIIIIMAESVSTWSMRTSTTDSVGIVVGNDMVVIRQMSRLVAVHLLSRCRPSGHQGKNKNYGLSHSSQQGEKWKLWCFRVIPGATLKKYGC